jgi:hypothetical protein
MIYRGRGIGIFVPPAKRAAENNAIAGTMDFSAGSRSDGVDWVAGGKRQDAAMALPLAGAGGASLLRDLK